MLQLDQRGGKPGSMGCMDNLLVDRIVLEDAQFSLGNPSEDRQQIVDAIV